MKNVFTNTVVFVSVQGKKRQKIFFKRFGVKFFDLLFDGDNVFEFIPPQVDGRLEWAEVLVLPANRCKQEACLPNGDSDCRNPRQAVFCALGALLRQQRHRAVSLCQAEVKTHVAVVSEVLEGSQESLRRHQRNRWSRAIAVRMHCPAGKRLNKLIT